MIIYWRSPELRIGDWQLGGWENSEYPVPSTGYQQFLNTESTF
ncbi:MULTISPECIES: hypothetical protein [Nostoc]|nr:MULTISPECIES: hypothetical protein [Nostoc]MDZ8010658.1 hypothetical protein [Nostoc sp. ZfuVER08]